MQQSCFASPFAGTACWKETAISLDGSTGGRAFPTGSSGRLTHGQTDKSSLQHRDGSATARRDGSQETVPGTLYFACDSGRRVLTRLPAQLGISAAGPCGY